MPTTDLLLLLRDEWRSLGRSPTARRSLNALRAAHGDEVPTGVTDLAGIVSALEPRGGLDQLQRARLVAALLERAEDPALRRCLLQTLIPGIVSVARGLRFGDGVADNPRTFLADAVSEMVELLDDWAGQVRPYAAPDLLSALRCRLRRRMLSDKAHRAELSSAVERRVDANAASAYGGVYGDEEFARELAVAATTGVTDVDLLYARCVLGFTSSELAVATGVTGGVLHRRLVAAAKPYVSPRS